MRAFSFIAALFRRLPSKPAIADRPAWLVEAERLQGVEETPGPGSTSEIMAWAADQAPWIRAAYVGDHVPWCGLFAAHCVRTAGLALPKNPLSALAWAEWGRPLDAPVPGAVAVFRRSGGGHVGFVVGEGARGDLLVLGGNQSDRVGVARFPRDRLVALRWAEGAPVPRNLPLIRDAGAALSTNEA